MYLLLLLLWPVLRVCAISSTTSFSCPAQCTCDMELKFASCASNNLTNLPTAVPPSTERLNLSFNQLDSIPYRAFWSMRRLHTLLLNDNKISIVANGAFSLLEALDKLDLSRNNISALTKGFSQGLGSLRELSLAENQLTSVDGCCFSNMDALMKLNLSHNSIKFVKIKAFHSLSTLRRIYLDGNKICSLSNGVFSMLGKLEVLGLRENDIVHIEVGALTPLIKLTVLDLANNKLNTVDFKAFLSLQSHTSHIRLAGNPWMCDCDLQRVFRKLHSVQRFRLDDYDNLTCAGPEQLRGDALEHVDSQLCFAETVTVLIITITVVITVVAAIVMAERKRKKTNQEKHWTEVSELSCDSQN